MRKGVIVNLIYVLYIFLFILFIYNIEFLSNDINKIDAQPQRIPNIV